MLNRLERLELGGRGTKRGVVLPLIPVRIGGRRLEAREGLSRGYRCIRVVVNIQSWRDGRAQRPTTRLLVARSENPSGPEPTILQVDNSFPSQRMHQRFRPDEPVTRDREEDSLERPSLSLVHEIACFLIARHQQEAPTRAANISSFIRVHPSRYNSTHLLLPSESNIDRRHACSIFPNCEKTASNSPLFAMLSVWPRNIRIDPFDTH